jgi:hypothetical protein
MTLSPITIQILPESQPSTPSWMGEVATFAQILMQTGILKAIQDRARFARARFGKSRPHRFCYRADRLWVISRTHLAGVL